MGINSDKNESLNQPDRPLECTECKRPVVIHYTEIVGKRMTCTGMCKECPQLQRHLHGVASEEETSPNEGKTGLSCGDCGTSLESVRMGNPLGCSTCYEIFGDILVSTLTASDQISHKVTKKKKSVPLHIGRQSGETQEISPSLQLIALNEALEETLKHEDYEQAAWLRDQIKELTENPENGHAKKDK